MLQNIENAQGKFNSALIIWDGDDVSFEPTYGAVIVTDAGGRWQLLGDSWWLDNAWRAESLRADAKWDGIRIRQTGRVARYDGGHDLGEAVRVEITFVHDGEEDTVIRGWMKVGRGRW